MVIMILISNGTYPKKHLIHHISSQSEWMWLLENPCRQVSVSNEENSDHQNVKDVNVRFQRIFGVRISSMGDLQDPIHWRYCTIFEAIFSGDIPWNLALKNRPFFESVPPMNRILSSMAIFQNSCVPPGNDPLKGGRPLSCLDVVQNAPVAFRRSVTKYEDSTDPATTNNHGYMPIIYI